MKKKKPTFIGLRIYLTSTLLYFFLVLPFVGFLTLQNLRDDLVNEFSSKLNLDLSDTALNIQISDSLDTENDSIQIPDVGPAVKLHFDSIIMHMADTPGDKLGYQKVPSNEEIDAHVDSIIKEVNKNVADVPEPRVDIKNERLNRFFELFSWYLLLSYFLGLVFNLPFKIFLKRKRKEIAIGDALTKFCKKLILYTPLINCLILSIPHIVSHSYGLSMLSDDPGNDLGRNLFQNFLYVSMASGVLTLLFVYFWQKNRVHLKYLEYFFSEEELRKRIFRSRSGKIRNQLWFASAITTFFPLAIVVLYLVLSLTSVKDLRGGELSKEQIEILLGNWSESIMVVWDENDNSEYNQLFYVNAIDSIIMFIGIGTGITVSIFYIFLIAKWTTRSIVSPVNELLGNMQKIRKNGMTDYTIVRTNDEVGELAEGFNVMIHKIRNYITSISEMNEDLEQKVIERTKEIEEKKEEIETQKEEIVSQLETVISQKDTIEGQQHQILDSIHYAKRIQSAILPPGEVLSKNLSDHFVLYNPRDIVSGDFYWNVAKNGKIYIAVADCTGHGVPGAFLSILGISYLNEIINKEGNQSTSEILGHLRTSLIASLHQKGNEGEAQDGMEVALCCIDLQKKRIQYSGANRPLYIVRKADSKQSDKKGKSNVSIFENGGFQLNVYQPDKMPIGIYDDAINSFTDNEIPIQSGDTIYLFTDGYVDQMGGPHRKTFRVKYFRELLLEIQDKDMNEQLNILNQNIKDWKGEVGQTDDMLVLGIRV